MRFGVLVVVLLIASTAGAQQHPPPQPPAEAGHAQPRADAPGVVQSGTAHAQQAVEHGEGHEPVNPNEIWWKWANFVILAAVLGYLASKHLGPYLRARTEQIQGGITEAAAMRAEAERKAGEIEQRIGSLAGEVESMRQKARDEVAAEGARVRAETEAQIAKLQTQAEQEIASAAKHASASLKAHAADLALSLAEGQIRDRMTGDVQDELNQAFVEDLRKKAGQN